MNKSILVIDTPKSCLYCKFYKNLDVHPTVKYGCRCLDIAMEDNNVMIFETSFENYSTKRHPNCPLQELPDSSKAMELIKEIKREIEDYFIYGQSEDDTQYNMDYILKELKNFITQAKAIELELKNIYEIIENMPEEIKQQFSKKIIKDIMNMPNSPRKQLAELKELATISYKGYSAVIKYSFADKKLYGKIENISDLVLFESDNAKDIEQAFQSAVDEYTECPKLRLRK